MSQTSKRPGAKDISELKARLGLKKSGPAAAKAGGGVIAPPGARLGGGAIPAPPGARPPQPVIPDAKEDPFGAMNALAAHGATQAQPQIVVVNDGVPVEQVHGRSRARLGIYAGLVMIPLILGIAVGKISAGAKTYNVTIDDAGNILKDITKVRDGLVGIQVVLQQAKLKSKAGFVANDAKLTNELAQLPALQPNIDVVFKSHLYDMDPQLVAAVLSFYVDLLDLNTMIKNHVEASKNAEKVIKKGQVAVQSFRQSAGPFGYAGLVTVPSDDDQKQGGMAKVDVVQLGSPICEGDKRPSDQGCQGKKVAGFRYRSDETGPWQVKKIATSDKDSVSADSLVMLGFNKALLQLVQGGDATVAEAGYLERVKKIDDRVSDLIEQQKAISSRLTNKANEAKKFTWFM